MNRRFYLVLLFAITVSASLAWVTLMEQQPEEPAAEISATLWPVPKLLAPFSLIDHHGEPFTNDNLRGRWNFIFFGFVHCPDVCPTTLAVLHQAYDRLDPALRERSRVLFVSVDPDRDTPRDLHRFIVGINGAFAGVTGDAGEIARLAQEFGVAYSSGIADDQGDYDVTHSGFVFLTDPDGRLHAVYTGTVTPDILLSDLRALDNRF